MAGSLARYHARSPRYTLDTQDNHLVRYSGAERFSWEEKTELKNISLTGLSFVASTDLSPLLGEIIKIQFAVPGSEMMACYAIVTRIEQSDDFENEIAVHFYKLDRIQRINLVQGLASKVVIHGGKSIHNQDTLKPKISGFKKLIAGIFMFTAGLLWITAIKIFWL
jgi:hypothetical protein